MANICKELYAAASLGDIDGIYKAIKKNPRILKEIDEDPFVNAPLHVAALAGKVRQKESAQCGASPCRNQQIKELVRVKGREGITPLHFICQCGDSKENIRLLIDFLEACPDCIEDVNVRNETALHVALINGNLRAFRVLIGWLKNNFRKGALLQETSILNCKDSAGSTILHVATLNHNKQAIDLLIERVKINAKNLENQTALDLAEDHGLPITIKTTLLKAKAKRGVSVDDDDSKREDKLTKSKLPLLKHFIMLIECTRTETSEEHRNTCMVIATLVLTAIYQTVLSSPGGLTQPQAQGGTDNNNLVNVTSSLNSTFNTTTTGAGKSVLRGYVFSIVTLLNSVVFLGGYSIILAVLPRVQIARIAAMALLLF
ncbi:hypothetical protein PIB30_049726 [Stylosanthes scabra]|uniref:PGG domain-containing protein n=1 Tax=Stylosanthes scabra TaxID=79078 RepID=A0ABU6SH99_9FABA|nr:hypothetical protein [Stylosanthes scabra]